MNLDLIIVFLYSYLIGSIPFGLLFTKIFLKKDVREIGSGNIGATNVLRTGNKLLASLTLIFDILKGYISIYITLTYFNDLIYLSALACFIGHIFSIWLKFRGGKGIATYLGIISAFSLKFTLIFGVIWLAVLLLFRYSSLSSIVSTLFIFFYSLILVNYTLSLYLFSVFVIVVFTHRENIIRLKAKKETKIKF